MKLKQDFGVRALLATIAVSGAVGITFLIVIQGHVELGVGFIGGLAMAVVGFYFGSGGSKPANGTSP